VKSDLRFARLMVAVNVAFIVFDAVFAAVVLMAQWWLLTVVPLASGAVCVWALRKSLRYLNLVEERMKPCTSS
jgi:hypothetical protein